MSFFGLTLTALYALLLFYVLWRAASLALLERRLRSWRWPAVGLLLTGLFVLARTYGHHGTHPLALGLERIGMVLLGAVFLLALPLFVVELMLSGHTHGGQIWPFGYLVQTVYPLLAGRYQIEGLTVIVSRGAGSWGPRMRLWHRGEILAVTLRALK